MFSKDSPSRRRCQAVRITRSRLLHEVLVVSENLSDTADRFIGIKRLFSAQGLERLRRAHVCVVGIGGVGSWVAEALARSSVGRLTLVDLDEICVSNINRQLHALDATIGQSKVEVMAARVHAINPGCEVSPRLEFFTEKTAQQILAPDPDLVVDAIDSVANKCRLIALARSRGIPVVTSGGAGGRRDPAQVRVADLAFTEHDRLLQKVRERLRKEHGFPTGRDPFGVDCVYSPEPPVFPQEDGSVCATKDAETVSNGPRLNCEAGLGSASFVTGTFGFLAAGRAIERIVTGNREPLRQRASA